MKAEREREEAGDLHRYRFSTLALYETNVTKIQNKEKEREKCVAGKGVIET